MQRAKFFKKFLMPCGLCAAVPVVKPASPSQECAENCSHDLKTKKLIRPSELPIYVEDINQQMPCADHVPSALELQVGEVRRSLQGVRDQYRYINDSFSSVIDTGKEHSRFMLDYLREESNILPRIGAVGIGSLSGLILGLRGGTFKRLVYSSTGAAAVGAVCYPKKAEEGVVLMKYYTNVVYNFVYGIKPGDDKQLQYTLPELPKLSVPTSISEAFEMVANAGSGIATAIGSLSQKAITTLNEKKEGSRKKQMIWCVHSGSLISSTTAEGEQNCRSTKQQGLIYRLYNRHAINLQIAQKFIIMVGVLRIDIFSRIVHRSERI